MENRLMKLLPAFPAILLWFFFQTFSAAGLSRYRPGPIKPVAGFINAGAMSEVGPPLVVRKCNDFTIDGKGTNSEWEKASWNFIAKLDTGSKSYESSFKILYSSSGIYVLFRGL